MVPLQEELLGRLGPDSKERPVVLVGSPKWLELIWEPPLIRRVAPWETIPMAFPQAEVLLVVHASPKEACCQIHAHGHSLEFTWQSVVVSLPKDNPLQTLGDWQQWSESCALMTPSHPDSLLQAILQCLHAAPRDVRRNVHLLVAGPLAVLVPTLPQRLAQQLQAHWVRQEGNEDEVDEEVAPELSYTTTRRPANGLASCKVQLLDPQPIRADGLAWTGASVWANLTHRSWQAS